MAKSKKVKIKFKIGDKAYSYMNKTKAGKISFRGPYDEYVNTYRYKLILPDGRQSKFINQESLRKTPIRK